MKKYYESIKLFIITIAAVFVYIAFQANMWTVFFAPLLVTIGSVVMKRGQYKENKNLQIYLWQ